MDGSRRTRKASADLSIFRRRGVFSSILQWRTFILVNPAICGVHALSFPVWIFLCKPPFKRRADYTVNKLHLLDIKRRSLGLAVIRYTDKTDFTESHGRNSKNPCFVRVVREIRVQGDDAFFTHESRRFFELLKTQSNICISQSSFVGRR